jgi:hypothetical protein
MFFARVTAWELSIIVASPEARGIIHEVVADDRII